jgi:tRNA-Thr(GGU) m(6)t(6)A37 methyltransferase TsaA
MSDEPRPGEVMLPTAALTAADGRRVVFIGRIRTPWSTLEACPKNLRLARESGRPARVEVDAPFRPGLADLDGFSHVVLLYWMDRARRDLIVQRPRAAEGPRGTFSLRSPVRPNPIGMGVARLIACDVASGVLETDAMDCLDGTPLLDIKPYFASVDAVPEASGP